MGNRDEGERITWNGGALVVGLTVAGDDSGGGWEAWWQLL